MWIHVGKAVIIYQLFVLANKTAFVFLILK